jgi:polysaccharide export outer membrane protein
MKKNMWNTLRHSAALVIAGTLILSATAIAAPNRDDDAKSSNSHAVEDYKIGADDVLVVSVPDAPEFGGKFRVSDSGAIDVPGVAVPIRAEGLSALELAHSIRQALIDAKQLRDPRVSVFVEEYHGRTVTVLGAVSKPSVYPLTKRTNVLEALSLAGGTLPNSGNTVTIVRGPASAEATNTEPGSVQIFKMSDLVTGKDFADNIEVKNGDVINVSSAQLVYVVGAVVKPGGYTMSDPSSGVSVVQAVALAEGLKSVASSHALIVRQSTNEHARVEIPVDLSQMIAGKTTDISLAPNDILYIPTSGTKQTFKVMGDFALAAVTGIAIYGIGYRISGVHP